MNGFLYTLRLVEPVLANSLAGDVNSAHSLLFVPGGLVRGALIEAYLRENRGNAADPEFRQLFLSGKTRYLHAYPQAEDVRTLPVPLALKVPKHGAAEEAINLSEVEPTKDEELKPVDSPGWWQRGETAYAYELAHHVAVHTQRDAVFGRAQTGLGAVFRYESLPPGLKVKGVILTESEADAEVLRRLLETSPLWLGKARTAGYGRVVVDKVADLPTDWREGWRWRPPTRDDEEDETAPPEAVSEFTLTFLSAALVRDGNGQFTLDPLPALRARLGVPEAGLEAVSTHRRMEIVGGFNRQWGLPLPQTPAIAAGSVFRFSVAGPIPLMRLWALEGTGIGERRAEGFGRLTIDWFQPETITLVSREWDEDRHVPDHPAPLSGAALEAAQVMLGRLLRREIDRRLSDRAATRLSIKGGDRIPNSQLSRWQVILRSALMGKRPPKEMIGRLTKFHAEEQSKHSPAWQRMQQARISAGGPRLTEWIHEVLVGDKAPWDQLGYNAPPERRLGSAAQVVADEKMAAEYRLRLIDAVLAAQSARNRGAKRRAGHD